MVMSMNDIAKTIGSPPMAPAILGPENFAMKSMIAVIAAAIRLLYMIVIMVKMDYPIVDK